MLPNTDPTFNIPDILPAVEISVPLDDRPVTYAASDVMDPVLNNPLTDPFVVIVKYVPVRELNAPCRAVVVSVFNTPLTDPVPANIDCTLINPLTDDVEETMVLKEPFPAVTVLAFSNPLTDPFATCKDVPEIEEKTPRDPVRVPAEKTVAIPPVDAVSVAANSAAPIEALDAICKLVPWIELNAPRLLVDVPLDSKPLTEPVMAITDPVSKTPLIVLVPVIVIFDPIIAPKLPVEPETVLKEAVLHVIESAYKGPLTEATANRATDALTLPAFNGPVIEQIKAVNDPVCSCPIDPIAATND